MPPVHQAKQASWMRNHRSLLAPEEAATDNDMQFRRSGLFYPEIPLPEGRETVKELTESYAI
jgi:hypothetical protein